MICAHPSIFSSLAHFKITPQTGVLEAHQSISIIVSFTPTQLGVFKNRFTVFYCDGLTSDEIRLVAEADKPGEKNYLGVQMRFRKILREFKVCRH